MAAIKNSSNVSVEFKPWTDDSKFRVVSLRIIEQLEGEVPKGEMDLFVSSSDDALKMITEENTGTIDIINEEPDIGFSYKNIKVYITERNYFGNFLSIKFIITDNIKFFTEKRTVTYDETIPLYKKIQSTFPGKSAGISPKGNIRIESDVPDTLLYQNSETNYEFNRRLCYSYKKNSIFAYGWEGLLIKDMMGDFNHKGNHEPDKEMEMESNRLTLQADTYNLTYNKKVNYEPFNPWTDKDDSTIAEDFSKVESKYARVIMNYGGYRVIDKNLEPYLKNSWHNGRLFESPGYTHFKVNLTHIPNFKLGDIIVYKKRAEQEEKTPETWKNYLVTSNELFFSIDATQKTSEDNFRFEWTSHLYGIDPGKWSENPE